MFPEDDPRSNEERYLAFAKHVLTSPRTRYTQNRTGVDTLAYFGGEILYDVGRAFPLFTTKALSFDKIAAELRWYLRGSDKLRELLDERVPVWSDNAFQWYLQRHGLQAQYLLYGPAWDAERTTYLTRVKEDRTFADAEGILGNIYGPLWRRWNTAGGKRVDQVSELIEGIVHHPTSRRHILTSWNPSVHAAGETALPCCCSFFQFHVDGDSLDVKLHQRSADKFLGEPWNVASWSLLLTTVAHLTGKQPRSFIHSLGNSHFYCGRGERGAFYAQHLPELQRQVREATTSGDYLAIKEWIERTAPAEIEGEVGLDHVTGVLEQFSRTPFPSALSVVISASSLDDLSPSSFALKGTYQSHPFIRRRMAV